MGRAHADTIEAVLAAYRAGCFPMADTREADRLSLPIRWIRPDRRAILPIEPQVFGLDRGVHIPRRLSRTVRRGRFALSCDSAFCRVVAACAEPRRESASCTSDTWIDARIEGLFTLLHDAGRAHSIEAWLERPGGELALVGGVYGLALGRVFCAESMFSRPDLGGTDASKVALVHLIEHCRRCGFTTIDTQFVNRHLEQFGVVEIDGGDYLRYLQAVGEDDVRWRPFQAGLVDRSD
ncbi:MAG: leucyl/phenylalanyl-tRNA--protein transferase [Planctomycetota bacterium]